MSETSRRALPAALALGLAAGLAGAALAQPAPDLGTEEQRAAGELVYRKYCAQCHGDDGAGEGIAAPYLRPAPRDFTSGKYRVRSTPTGYLPTDDDLRRSILVGLPGTGMPGFEAVLSDAELRDVIYYLKSLAPDFADPQAYAEPLALPRPPGFSEESLETGFETYVEIGCARCHGDQGRGDGMSAPTLRDDWGHFIPPADLSMPWTFRGGGSRENVFRSISTGLSGTPMAGFADGLSEEQRWQIVDWIVAQARSVGAGENPGEAPYGTLVRAVPHGAGLEAIAEGGDLQAARELFAEAPKTLFPVVGQIIRPGRAFRPGTVAIGVQAIYDRRDIAFLLTWHNITAETGGANAPDVAVPAREEPVTFEAAPPAEEAAAEAEPAPAALDVFGQPAADAAPAPGRPPGSDEFSDAVAIQVPIELREGVEKPYFLFGDPQYPVELWFVDLAEGAAELYQGRGADALAPSDAPAPEVLAGYADGEWAVVFKRPRSPARGVRFEEESFVPIAFSVWDGFYRERGAKRGLTRWFHVYVEPMAARSVVAPMAKAGLTVLGLELLVIGLVRWRYRRRSP
jgi:mono/diheme cytochrome c family protein